MTLSGEVFVDLTLDPVLTPIKVFLYDGDNAAGGSVSVDGKDVGRTGEVVQVPLCSRELIVQNGVSNMEGIACIWTKDSHRKSPFKCSKSQPFLTTKWFLLHLGLL